MSEHFIKKEFAEIHEADGAEKVEGGVRVYKSHPGLVTLQIRATSKLNPFGKGKPRKLYSNVRLTRSDIELLMNALQQEASELSS